jgi:hypothetical protein
LRGGCRSDIDAGDTRECQEAIEALSESFPELNEGYVFSGDSALIAARVVSAPWLTTLQPLGADVTVVLETDGGTVTIEGETVVGTFDIHHDDQMLATQQLKQEMPSFPALHQGGVRYLWVRRPTA